MEGAFENYLKVVLEGIALPRLRRPTWGGGGIILDSWMFDLYIQVELCLQTNFNNSICIIVGSKDHIDF